MKKFVCISCGRKWYVDEIDEKAVMSCPYCAKKIIEERLLVIDSFDKALLKVIHWQGKEILKNKTRLLAYLFDLAPDYKKEIRIFSKACSPELLQLFYGTGVNDSFQHKEIINKARILLLEEEGLSLAWADSVINALIYALEWEDRTVFIGEQKDKKEDTSALSKEIAVLAVGDNGYGQCDIEEWDNIVSVSSRYWHTIGLKKDKTVVAVGDNQYGQCNVKEWENIVAVSCGSEHTVGLQKNGRVLAVGCNKNLGMILLPFLVEHVIQWVCVEMEKYLQQEKMKVDNVMWKNGVI